MLCASWAGPPLHVSSFLAKKMGHGYAFLITCCVCLTQQGDTVTTVSPPPPPPDDQCTEIHCHTANTVTSCLLKNGGDIFQPHFVSLVNVLGLLCGKQIQFSSCISIQNCQKKTGSSVYYGCRLKILETALTPRSEPERSDWSPSRDEGCVQIELGDVIPKKNLVSVTRRKGVVNADDGG